MSDDHDQTPYPAGGLPRTQCGRGEQGTLVRMLAFAIGLAALGVAAPSPGAPAGPATQPQAAPWRPTLMATGTASHVWIAQVESYKEGAEVRHRTVLRGRALPDGYWQNWGAIHGQAIALASEQNDAALLFEDGTWKRIGAQFSTGTMVPGAGPVLAWAAGPRGLLAIRAFEGGKAGFDRSADRPAGTAAPASLAPPARPSPPKSSTQPATRPLTITTAPASATKPSLAPSVSPGMTTSAAKPVAAAWPVLFELERGRWRALADLPPAAAAPASSPATSPSLGAAPAFYPVSLAYWNQRIVLAIAAEPTTLETFMLSEGAWAPWGRSGALAVVRRSELIPGIATLALWMIDQDGVMKLSTRTDDKPWTAPQTLALPGGVPAEARRAMARAGDRLLLVLHKDQELWEQLYDASGSPQGAPTKLPQPVNTDSGQITLMFQIMLAIVVLAIVLTIVRRRRAEPPAPTGPGGEQE